MHSWLAAHSFSLPVCLHAAAAVQDKLKEASSTVSAAAPASPEQGKVATRLRAELEVHKEALATAKEEVGSLASSLEKANSWIEVGSCSARADSSQSAGLKSAHALWCQVHCSNQGM